MRSEKDILLKHMYYTREDIKALMQEKALFRRGAERERILQKLSNIIERPELEAQHVKRLCGDDSRAE